MPPPPTHLPVPLRHASSPVPRPELFIKILLVTKELKNKSDQNQKIHRLDRRPRWARGRQDHAGQAKHSEEWTGVGVRPTPQCVPSTCAAGGRGAAGEPRPGWPGRCVSSAGHGSRAKAGRGVCSQAGSSAVAGELVRAVAPGLRAQTLRQLIPPNVSEGRTAPAAKSSKEAVGGPLDAFLGRRFALRFWKLLAISRCTAKI